MNLTGIIAISGKSGLFKVVAQGKNNIIVESLEDRKRFPAYASDRISALEDISIYTYDEDKPLKEIFSDIYTKENGGEAISHKEDGKSLASYLSEILPNYDQERVYPSDIKKLFQWYNLLQKTGELKMDEAPAGEAAPEVSAEGTAEAPESGEKAEKKPAAKKTATAAKKPAASAEKKAAPKSAGKATGAKKAPAKTGGTSRGK
jgi:hypothetical protein